MSSYNVYPESGIGMILSYSEVNDILDKINQEEDTDLSGVFDFCYDTEIGPNLILPMVDILWECIRTLNNEDVNIDYDHGCIITAKNKMLPFAPAYKNVEELVEEMKGVIGRYLPENFDYKNRIIRYEIVFEE